MGAVVGSFIHAFVSRRLMKQSIVHGRSICFHCKKQLCWYENIPIVSFLFQLGRCRNCQTTIPSHYVFVELVGALFGGFIAVGYSLQLLPDVRLVVTILAALVLLGVFAYDIIAMQIPDEFSLWPAVVFFVIGFLTHNTIVGMLLGVILISGFFFFQFVISRGRWIGGGDVRLGVLMGVLLGWKLGLVALFLAYTVGAIISIGFVIAKKKKLASEVPFGTYLSVATVASMIFGDWLMEWYVGLVVL